MTWFDRLLTWFGVVDYAAPSASISFASNPENPLSLTGTITPGTPTNNVPVAKLVATVTITGSTSPPIVVDVTHNPADFPCNVGDKGDVTLIAYSAAGIPSAPTVVPFDLTAPDAVPVTLTFAQAPAAS